MSTSFQKNDTLLSYSLRTLDKGCLSLHWIDSTEDKETPILLLLHGLTGGSHSKYITQFAHYMVNESSKKHKNKPWRPVVYERRGCGVNDMTSEYPYTYCNLDDLNLVLDNIKSQFPNAPIVRIEF